jgi:hypothetical protein
VADSQNDKRSTGTAIYCDDSRYNKRTTGKQKNKTIEGQESAEGKQMIERLNQRKKEGERKKE